MDSKLRQAFIETNELRSEKVSEIYCGTFDFLLCSSSWDRRSVVIAGATSLSAEFGLLFHFEKTDSSGLSKSHQETLNGFFSDSVSNPTTQCIDATAIHENWDLLRSELLRACKKIGRPLDLFVDLSTTPRYLTLGVLGTGFRNGLVRSIAYGYSEGSYADSDTKQELFTEGGWAATAIPGLAGEWEPHRFRHYIVSVGFEGTKTRQLVSKLEPDFVSLVFPDPPVKKEYGKRTEKANRPLIDDYLIAPDKQVRAPATCLVQTLKSLEEANLEDYSKQNCLYVCCGTKPHSLAFAIRSLIKGEPALMYIVPESHRVSNVRSNGIYWRYDVKDCSSTKVFR